MNRLNEELKRIFELSNYNPASFQTKTPKKVKVNGTIVESKKGANGKFYAIVCECSNFFIKECKDDNKINLSEGYDYIGGLANKLDYCYTTLDEAKENLYLKLQSINESVEKNKRVVFNPKNYSSVFNTKQSLDMREMLNLYEEKNREFTDNQEFGEHPKFQEPVIDVKKDKTKPYATKIGSNFPFDEILNNDDLLNSLAETICRNINKLKKKSVRD